ncbi:MAG: transporter substrate-binding domain-containing protein [Pseudomonadota bacterium]|nr:transporter substrate-binding domain-containing protein [Pseudomonadota bacterium]
MMSRNFFLSLLLALTFALPAAAQTGEPTYDRVIKTGILRCGYYMAPPLMAVDAGTGKKSGFLYNLTEEAAKGLGLKVEWVEEISTGTMFEGLGLRYDAICTGIMFHPARARLALFSQPQFTQPVNIYVRADDHRFDDNLEAFNDPKMTFAGWEGDSSSLLVKQEFPRAKLVELPQTATPAERILMVTTGKADAAILEDSVISQYMLENPGKIRRAMSKPYKAMTAAYAFPLGENRLKAMFDATLTYMNSNGIINRLIAKHQKAPGDMLPPPLTYGEPVSGKQG